jgi:PAS domain S-box-containing protein
VARILDKVPQPVWVIDGAGRIDFANPAAVAVLGYDDAAQLHGQSSHDTVHYMRRDGSPYPESECPMMDPSTTGETVHGDDEWFIRRDGSIFPISWWSAPLDARGGGVVLAFTDITDQRAAEQAIRERDAAVIRAAESRAAQRRLIESVNAARRRITRDIHDGAQQRLVNLMIELRIASDELPPGAVGARALLRDATEQAQAAIDELRELSAGIHPRLLTARGLVAAIDALAARSTVPVSVVGLVSRDLPPEVEASAYFIVAEALTNAVKHARASHVTVDARTNAAELDVTVRDDGIGGARPRGPSSGLAGVADRIAALDGRISIDSPLGEGTTLHVRIPLDGSG